MAHKIVVSAIRKGGPGKTMCSTLLLEYYAIYRNALLAPMPGETPPQRAARQWRAFGIDWDSQCHLSRRYVPMEQIPEGKGWRPPSHQGLPSHIRVKMDRYEGRSHSALIFSDISPTPYQASRLQGVTTLDILPGSTEHLLKCEQQEYGKFKKDFEDQGRQFFEECGPQLQQLYDLTVIDTSPHDGFLTRIALRSATHLLIPIELSGPSWDGMQEMLGMWRDENRHRSEEDRLQILMIQPNRVKLAREKQNFYLEMANDPAIKSLMSTVELPDLADFENRDAHGASPRSVFQLGKKNKARQLAIQFGDFAHERLFGGRIEAAPKVLPQEGEEESTETPEATYG